MLQGAAPVLWLNRSEAFYRSVSARLSGLAAVRKRGRVAGGGGPPVGAAAARAGREGAGGGVGVPLAPEGREGGRLRRGEEACGSQGASSAVGELKAGMGTNTRIPNPLRCSVTLCLSTCRPRW